MNLEDCKKKKKTKINKCIDYHPIPDFFFFLFIVVLRRYLNRILSSDIYNYNYNRTIVKEGKKKKSCRWDSNPRTNQFQPQKECRSFGGLVVINIQPS